MSTGGRADESDNFNWIHIILYTVKAKQQGLSEISDL